MRYQPHQVEMTPQLVPPTALRLRWELHMLSHRDHALWRVQAHEGMNEELVGLGVYPCPALDQLDDLDRYVRAAVTLDLDAARGYMYPRGVDPFPVPRNGGAPAA